VSAHGRLTRRVLVVLTSHGQLGDTGKATGFQLVELAEPYYALRDAGHAVTLASIRGGKPPTASARDSELAHPAVQRLLADQETQAALERTVPIDSVNASAFDAVFLPGGHGTVWDFPASEALAQLVGTLFDAGKPVAAVCHGPAGLLAARRADGRSILHGRRVNGFANDEERAIGLDGVVPYLLQDRLAALAGEVVVAPPFTAFALRDGPLITGQNPMSSAEVARLLLQALAEPPAGIKPADGSASLV
jgi:putative intracellular protease/amidase